MSRDKLREIASKGGRAGHEQGKAHEWTSEEAREAGRKGGQVSRGGRGRLTESGNAAQKPQQPDFRPTDQPIRGKGEDSVDEPDPAA